MLTPLPNADQFAPFHRAIPGTAKDPTVENSPPTYRAGPEPSSKAMREKTVESYGPIGSPTADQCVPFHLTMLFGPPLPVVLICPPAYKAEPEPSSKPSIDKT